MFTGIPLKKAVGEKRTSFMVLKKAVKNPRLAISSQGVEPDGSSIGMPMIL